MAAFFKAFPLPGRRLAVVGSARPAPAAATIVCIWQRDRKGRLVRRWIKQGDESIAPATLAWAA